MKDIIKRIKGRREALGYSFQDLADRTGMSKSTLQRYESGGIKNVPLDKLDVLAKALGTSPAYILGWDLVDLPANTVEIPILGSVPAGVPVEAVEDVVGYVEVKKEEKDHFALRIKGDSMQPDIQDGDVVIVKKQESVENGEVAIVYVNDFEATCKKVIYTTSGLILQPLNRSHAVQAFTKEEMEEIPVKILGKVTEIRRIL